MEIRFRALEMLDRTPHKTHFQGSFPGHKTLVHG